MRKDKWRLFLTLSYLLSRSRRGHACVITIAFPGTDHNTRTTKKNLVWRHFPPRLRRVTWRRVSSLALLCSSFTLTGVKCSTARSGRCSVVPGRPAAAPNPVLTVSDRAARPLKPGPLSGGPSRDPRAAERRIKDGAERGGAERTTRSEPLKSSRAAHKHPGKSGVFQRGTRLHNTERPPEGPR